MPHLPFTHHQCVREVLQAISRVDLKSVCTDGQDGVVLDPWVHCHGLGALQLTLEPPYQPNLCTCCLHNHLWEPTKALQSKGSGIICWSASLPHLLVPKFAPPTSYATLSTPTASRHYKRGCGAQWRSAPFISKLSKLLQAL